MNHRSEFLGQFARHTPRILRRQLILQLAEQYLGGDKSEDLKVDDVCRPSIQRFHGALLFIDISGFTVLSQKLTVEDLKNHINEYFTKMLDIVDRHDGDVVKFAGDALFIIWESQASVTDGGKHSLEELSKIAIEKAVDCGREINETCCNHKIVLNHNKAVRRISYDSEMPLSPLAPTATLTAAQMMSNFHHGHGSNHTEALKSPTNGFGSPIEEECAYLNVHSGVSVGLMAGIDIGADNRWEYFLIGEPLSKVAEAESQASSGDMIMCPESHALLHPLEHTMSTTAATHHSLSSIVSHLRMKFRRSSMANVMSAPVSSVLPCGCTSMKNGYCKIKIVPNAVREVRKVRRRRGSIEENNSHVESIDNDIQDVVKAFDLQFKKEYTKHTQSYRLMKPGGLRHGNGDLSEEVMQRAFCDWAETCLTDDIARHVHHVMRSEYVFSDISRQGAYERDFEEAWATHSHHHTGSQQQQLQQLQQSPYQPSPPHHAHSRNSLLSQSFGLPPMGPPSGSATRHSSFSALSSGSSSGPATSCSTVVSGSEKNLPASPLMRSRTLAPSTKSPSNGEGRATPPLQLPSSRPSSRQSHSASDDANESDGVDSHPRTQSDASSAPSRNSFTKKRESLRPSQLSPLHDKISSLSAELRSVTVLFIKIMMNDAELLIDSSKRTKLGGSYHFLGTTLNERVADQRLLNKYQKAIEVLSGVLTSYGGQMRQFIVDDKGTVCIGTFGLRGSVSDDNAAAALDAAHAIIMQMQVQSLQCSIGVTVGRAYCGLVGSSNRHEYAVMGPSTNLSARLMCKAPAYGVICDIETRRRDRTHIFVTLEDIIAKGYSAPVGTFKPVFPEVEAFLNPQQEFSVTYYHSHASNASHQEDSSVISYHQSNKVVLRMIQATSHRVARLQGRSEEVTKAITFAFHGIIQDTPTLAEEDYELMMDCRFPARFVGIIGTDGMGKSHLSSSIAERVYNVAKHTSGCNIQMFKSRHESFNSDVPFNAWRPIMLEMIARIYRSSSRKSGTSSPRKSGTSSPRKSTTSSSEINEGVACVMSMLPSELSHLQPLFGFLSIGSVRQEALKALHLSTTEKINHSIQLLLAVIELYSTTSKNLIFITMEDVQSFDMASLRLIHEVHASSTGVIVMFTGRTTKHSGVRTDSVDPGNILHDFIAPIKRSSRFLELELEGLSKAATVELIRNALQKMGVKEVDASFYDRVYEVSGGNPLYAYEIAKSFAHNEMAGKIAPLVHNVRTEEVICYRFDQLKTSAQSLLKMVAVICANKATFSLTMLTRMDDWDLLEGCESFAYPVLTDAEEAYWSSEESYSMEEVYSPTKVKYGKILFNILRCESFIRLVSHDHNHDEFDDSSVEMLLASNAAFEFAIPLEQSTIYNLLLDDQKHALHEGVAEYLARCRGVDGIDNDVEEGFHWHKAAVWAKSMTCHFRAYEGEPDSVQRGDHLDLAYQALQGLASTGEIQHLGISYGSLRAMYEEALQGGDRKSELDGHVVTLERVYEIFSGDSRLLLVGLSVLIHVAQQRKHRFESSAYTQLILEDALQIALQTKNPFLMSASYLDMLTNARSDARVDGEELNLDEMHFYLRNFWPLFFRTLSSYCMNYVMSTVNVSDYSRKAAFIAEQFLKYARTEGGVIDLIQALNINAMVQNKLSNLRASIQFIEELRVIYVFETHSAQLIQLYGADHLIYMLTRTIKYAILAGNTEEADGWIGYAIHWFHSLTHVASLTLSVLRLVSVLAYINRFEEALALLTRYEHVLDCQSLHVTEYVPAKIIALCREWINRHIAFQSDNSENGAEETRGSQELIGQVEVLVSSKDKHILESNSLLVYHKQQVMIVLADLYAMKVKKDVQSESELTNDCLVCCMYLQNVMVSQTVDTHDVFNKARAVHIVQQILRILQSVDKNTEYHKKFRKVFTVPILSDLRRDAQINQLYVLSKDVTEINEQLHGDVF